MFKKLIAPIIACLLTACAAATPIAETAVAPAATPSTELRRGVNVLGYDPIWTDPAKGRFQQRHFAEIRQGGFDFVRVNLAAFKHMNADNQLSPAFLDRLDWIVKNATAAGLSVIIDEHDFNACSDNVDTCRAKL